MIALFCLFLGLFASPFKSKSRLEAENAALRHQLIVQRVSPYKCLAICSKVIATRGYDFREGQVLDPTVAEDFGDGLAPFGSSGAILPITCSHLNYGDDAVINRPDENDRAGNLVREEAVIFELGTSL